MAIVNGTVSTYAVSETLGAQTQANGTNEIVFSDTLLNLTSATADIGSLTTYASRVIILRRGTGTEETRFCSSVTAGTGTTQIATVTENWTTAPTSGDAVDVFYNIDDMNQDGSYLNSRTGFYEFNEDFIIQNNAGVFIGGGDLVEIVDSKSATNYGFTCQSGGRLQVGYLREGTPVSGGVVTGVNNSQGETWMDFQSGSVARIYDARFLASLNPLQINFASGCDTEFEDFSLLQATDEGLYFNTQLKNGSITGSGGSTEIVRLNSSSFFDQVRIINTAGLDTASGDTTTETLNLRDCIWVGNIDFIRVNSNKTWEVINPNWSVTQVSDLNFLTTTSNVVNDRRSVDATVLDSALSPIQNSLVIVYEGLVNDDLVIEGVTDASGVVNSSFVYRTHPGGGTTTTFGTHSLRIDSWSYTPFVLALSSTSPYEATTSLSDDNFLVQTVQATAITNGSGITWNEDTNPSSIIAFTGGTGTLNVGDTVTGGTSGATGVVTAFLDGDSSSGTFHLETRNANAFSGTESLSSTGWSGTLTSGSEKRYTIWIDANSLSLQTVYDYLAALTSQTTLSATGELIHEWGKSSQGRALYSNGSQFFTERSGTEGVIVVNYGAGNVLRYTADDGTFYIPPVQYNYVITNLKDGTEVRIHNATTNEVIAGVEDVTGGVGTDLLGNVTIGGTTDSNTFTYTYTYSSDISIYVVLLNLQYQIQRIEGQTLTNASGGFPAAQIFDRNYKNP